jgi:hypothetical protein
LFVARETAEELAADGASPQSDSADIEMKPTLPFPRNSDVLAAELERVSLHKDRYYYEGETGRDAGDFNRPGSMRTGEVINSPFFMYEEFEKERRYSESSQATSHVSDKSQSLMSDSSESTVKWRDTKDLHFRMAGNMALAGRQKEGHSLWERATDSAAVADSMRRGHSRAGTTSRSKSSAASTPATAAESLAASFLQLFVEVGLVASSVIYGTYSDFGFTDFSPRLFSTLREMIGVDADSYQNAFKSTANENFSEGRSGAFMFNSCDHRFIVKTTTQAELNALLTLLPNYIQYLKRNPNSLLARFLGAHCITMYSTKLYFIVMLNVFPKEKLSEKYDLKGSWVNRFGNRGDKLTRREKLRAVESIKSVPLYQDNDVQQKICLREQVARELLCQVQKDTQFLASK